ncbi:hypothetical protein GC169_09335 [bacterium]|nr:hypothetical protein [bacterium]
MAELAAIGFCILIAGLGVFQAMLALGAPLGRFAWGGQSAVLSTRLRVGSVIAIGLYVLFSLIVLERAGLVPAFGSAPMAHCAIWVLAAYLVFGVGLNAISRSKSERMVMTPLAAALLALVLIVALA